MNDRITTLRKFLEENLQNYLQDLKNVVEIDSGSDDKPGLDRVCTYLQDLFTQMGAKTIRYTEQTQGDHLLATLDGDGKGSVLLLGHLDTVYAHGTTASRPMRISDQRIFGPGTCDMKGGLLLGIYTLRALQTIGYKNFKQIRFLIVSDEETSQRSSIPLIQENSRMVDTVLCLEAARQNGDIVSCRKGIHWYTIEAFGKAAHAGVEPGKGANAILALAHHIPALHHLNGGRAPNVVPDYASVSIDVRAFSRNDLDILENRIRSLLEPSLLPGVRLQLSQEEGALMPPMERTPDVAKLESMAIGFARDLGMDIKGVATGGASDASYAAAEGTPTLDGFGPVGGQAHSVDEYLELDSIVPRSLLLARMIMAIS